MDTYSSHRSSAFQLTKESVSMDKFIHLSLPNAQPSDAKQLDKMDKELQCSICLGLLKRAASLSCNHCFCTSCILESLRSVPCCPLCKCPTSRREVRPASHMDSLVVIYKDMRSAASRSNTLAQEKDSRRISYPPKKRQKGKVFADLTNGCELQNALASKDSKTEFQSDKICDVSREGSCFIRGIMPAKKRIQVPPFGSVEREICSLYDEPLQSVVAGSIDRCKTANGDVKECQVSQDKQSSNYNQKIGLQKRQLKASRALECPSAKATELAQKVLDPCFENGNYKPNLAPFFWLREQNSEEDGTEAKIAPLLETPLERPAFSDLKDSDDDCGTQQDLISKCSSVNEDTDMFNWRHRLRSPELNSSPMRAKTCITERSLLNDKKCASQKAGIDFDKDHDGDVPNVQYTCAPTFDSQLHKSLHKHKYSALENDKKDRTEGVSTSASYRNGKEIEIVKRNGGKKSFKDKDPTQIASTKQGPDLKDSGATKKKKHGKDADAQNIDLLGTDTEVAPTEAKVVASTFRKPNQSIVELNREDPVCAFCQTSGDSEVAGSMMQYLDGALVFMSVDAPTSAVTVHKLCAEWAPEVYFTDDTAHNLSSEIARSLKLKCNSCGAKGAALGCFLKRCPKTFHYPCARALRKSKWNLDNFIMLCPDHRSCKFPGEPKKKDTIRKSKEPISQASGASCENKENVEVPTDKAHHRPLLPSPQNQKWAPGPHQKWVLCGSALDSDGKSELASFAYFTGAAIVKTYTTAVTHVITATDKDGAARRTLKFLMGTLEGKWILKADWLSACLAAGKPVEEDSFEVYRDIHGVIEGPKRGRAFVAAQAPKLFNEISFYFSGHFEPAFKTDLQSLIQAGSGTILYRKPVSCESESKGKVSRKAKRGQNVVVIYNVDPSCTGSLEDKRNAVEVEYMEAYGIAEGSHASVLAHTWILDSAAGWKLQPFQ